MLLSIWDQMILPTFMDLLANWEIESGVENPNLVLNSWTLAFFSGDVSMWSILVLFLEYELGYAKIISDVTRKDRVLIGFCAFLCVHDSHYKADDKWKMIKPHLSQQCEGGKNILPQLSIPGPLNAELCWCRIHIFIFFCRKRWKNIYGW